MGASAGNHKQSAENPARLREVAGIVLIAAGLVFAGYGVFIPARAALVEVLLERAWTAAPEDGPAPRPWPWADARPVAKINLANHEVALIVLSGEQGPTLPFGPSHVAGTSLPGEPGHSVVAAGSRAHFMFLRSLRIGERIEIERPGGAKAVYVVVEKDVLDVRKAKIALEPSADLLTLVTCYPFSDWNPRGPLRYVVTAVADPA